MMKPTSTMDNDEEAVSTNDTSHHNAPAKTPVPIHPPRYLRQILAFCLIALTVALVVWFWCDENGKETQPVLPDDVAPWDTDEPLYRIVINGKMETKNLEKGEETTLEMQIFSEYFDEVPEGEILPVVFDREEKNHGLIVTVESTSAGSDDRQVNLHVVHVLKGGCLYDHVWTVPLEDNHFSLQEADPVAYPDLSCVQTGSSTIYDYHWKIFIKSVDIDDDSSAVPASVYRVAILDHVTNLPLFGADATAADVLWWKQEENLHWYGMEDLTRKGSTIRFSDTINGEVPSTLPLHTATLLDEGPNFVILQVVVETNKDDDDEFPDLCGGWQHVFVVPIQRGYGWADELVHYCNGFEIQQDVDVGRVME